MYATFAILASMWLLLKTIDDRQLWIGILAGAVFGAGFWGHKGYVALFLPMLVITAIIVVVNNDLRRRSELWAFLAVSVLVSCPFLYIIFGTDYLESNLSQFYKTQYAGNMLSSLFDVVGHARRVVEVVLMVQNPTNNRYSIDGLQSLPFLFGWFIALFWFGLGVSLLSLKQRRYQLLVLCWLIAIPSIIVFYGFEPRRYLLGLYCLYAFVAVGFNCLAGMASNFVKDSILDEGASSAARHGVSIISWIVVALMALVLGFLFIQENRRQYDAWNRSQEVQWFFSPEVKHVIETLHRTGESQRVCIFSSERIGAWDYPVARLMAPNLEGVAAATEHGGDGTLKSCAPVDEGTVIVLFDDYMHLQAELESTYPGGFKTRVAYSPLSDQPDIVYVVYSR